MMGVSSGGAIVERREVRRNARSMQDRGAAGTSQPPRRHAGCGVAMVSVTKGWIGRKDRQFRV